MSINCKKNFCHEFLSEFGHYQFGETALEFARNVNIEEVKAITDIYHHVRFGGHRLTKEETNVTLNYLSAIKRIKD